MEFNLTEVLGVLLQIIDNGTFAMVAEPIKMTIQECLEKAALINNSSEPFLMFCAPIPEGLPA